MVWEGRGGKGIDSCVGGKKGFGRVLGAID